MTMVPSVARLSEILSAGGLMSRLEGFNLYDQYNNSSMAEDDSRTNSTTLNDEPAPTISKENNIAAQDDERESNNNNNNEAGWLQLGIGGGHVTPGHDPTTSRRGGPVELDLFSSSPPQTATASFSYHFPEFRVPPGAGGFGAARSFLWQPGSGGSGDGAYFPHQEINWAFWPVPVRSLASGFSSCSSPSTSSSSPSSSAALMMMMPPPSAGGGAYFGRPFQVAGAAAVDVGAGPSSDLRVIDAPRRPHSGIWCMLQASQNHRDGRMTVRLLVKYLVNKLELGSESEVVVTPTISLDCIPHWWDGYGSRCMHGVVDRIICL
ncbi:protein LAX PANICLE 2-like isoform X3 [Malania oleifera]|uniref:protein LAX PANICLE 2-like isoform X3 n=1 Tax=Malania oleifera TaxID=397392 RepID=UPI0025AE2A1C|nr:protein LAX PANICLE 2-like isoform X3 [Malania oleifera]